MRKQLLILLLLPAIALANSPIFGEPSGGGMFPHQHHKPGNGELPLPGFLQQLDLTEKQKTEIKALLEAHSGEFESKINQSRKLATEIHRLSFSNDYSEEKSLALFDKTYTIHKGIALHKARQDNAIFNLLTGEQQQKLQGKMAHLDD